ncbi:MAG: outer membrane protein assembly factor BamA, partial [Bdellovibrionaceae bacterium]|nr:outer membrane protein assembly factor BamA [Pseudobdellovibrionaceae bacterium]
AYNELGFLNTKVNVEVPEIEKNRVAIKMQVDEGAPTKIQEIKLSSENKEILEKIQKSLAPFKTRPFTESTLYEMQKKVRDYFKENQYIQAEFILTEKKYTEDELFVNLSFVLNKLYKYSFDFEGYSQVSRLKLNQALDLENYSSTNPNPSSELALKLKNYYLERGFARVDVRAELLDLSPYSKKIVFKIHEGSKIYIDKLIFQGNFSKSEKDYEQWFYQGASELIQDRFYNKDQVDLALANLKLELQNKGYLMVQLQNQRTVYTQDKDKVNIYINIEEGPQTLIDSVDFKGMTFFTKEELIKLIELDRGQPLELFKLEKAIAKIKNKYQESGFIEVNIANEKENLVIYDESNTRAKIDFVINEGPQVKVSSIAIEGNFYTQEKIILIELEFKPGETLTPVKIDDSIARLQKTGFFNTVEIKTLEQRTSISNRTVLVKVTERDPGLFNIGAGATNERQGTIRGYTGIGYRNILGTGRGVSARVEGKYNIADIKYPELKIILGYVEPYLFFTRLRGRINISKSRYVSDFGSKVGTESNQYSYAIEKDFTTHITGIFDVYNLESSRDFLISNNQTTQEVSIASLGPTIDIDYRDNPFLPTSGIFARFNLEYANPVLGSSDTIEFYKTTGSFTHYLPFHKKWVLAHNLRLGYLENLNNKENGGVPYNKRGFILGGRSTIRGFEIGTQEVIPNNQDLGISDGQAFNLKTSATEFLFKSEVRFPIYGNFYGGVFYDGGSVYIKNLPFKDNYRDSVGVGLRYNTPVGALNMEIGKKLDRKEGESDIRYHLSFGTF